MPCSIEFSALYRIPTTENGLFDYIGGLSMFTWFSLALTSKQIPQMCHAKTLLVAVIYDILVLFRVSKLEHSDIC